MLRKEASLLLLEDLVLMQVFQMELRELRELVKMVEKVLWQ